VNGPFKDSFFFLLLLSASSRFGSNRQAHSSELILLHFPAEKRYIFQLISGTSSWMKLKRTT
jgi:hypothetical protein